MALRSLPPLARALVAVALLVPAVLLPACATATDSADSADQDALSTKATVARPVQMNDVSVLFPLMGKTQAAIDSAYLSPSSAPDSDKNAALLPRDVFDLANKSTAGFRNVPTYESMRLVGFRFDPCFANIGPIKTPSKCQNQLRVIFQAVSPNGTPSHEASADDGAFHVFFSLTRTQLAAALDEMTALRIANDDTPDLGPLAIHPIVKKQGMTGPMAKGLEAIVLKYADPKDLVKVTSFHGVFAQGTSWMFDEVDIKNGASTLVNIPTMKPAGTVESLRLGTAPEGLLSLSIQDSTSPDGNHLLLSPVQQENATAKDRQAAYDAAARVENPNFHSPNTIDCTSCHTAQISRQLIGEQFFKMSPKDNVNIFAADPIVPVADLALTVPVKMPTGLSLNLHAFSYDGTEPTIISRVVNESASIVAYVNTSLLKKAPVKN